MVLHGGVELVWSSMEVWRWYGPPWRCGAGMVLHGGVELVWSSMEVWSWYGPPWRCGAGMVLHGGVELVWSSMEVWSWYDPIMEVVWSSMRCGGCIYMVLQGGVELVWPLHGGVELVWDVLHEVWSWYGPPWRCGGGMCYCLGYYSAPTHSLTVLNLALQNASGDEFSRGLCKYALLFAVCKQRSVSLLHAMCTPAFLLCWCCPKWVEWWPSTVLE